MTVGLRDLLTPLTLRMALAGVSKRAQFAVIDDDGTEVEGDAEISRAYGGSTHRRGDVLDVPVAGARELLADIEDLAFLGAGFGRDHFLSAEDVVEIALGERTVFAHDLRTRVLQRAVALGLRAPVGRALPAAVFSFRPQRSREQALLAGRRCIRRGWVFAAKVDVRRFFDSITAEHVVRGMSPLRVSADVVRLVVWFTTPRVVRCRPNSAPEFLPPRYTLLQGSTIAPTLSNLAGAHYLDRPFNKIFGGRAACFRYADDVVVLGPSYTLVTQARDALVELIEAAGWAAHTDKTSPEAVDLRDATLRWLGKDVNAAGVVTPHEKIAERLSAFLSAERRSPLFASMCTALVNELVLDDWQTVVRVIEDAEESSRAHGAALRRTAEHLRPRRRARMRAYDRMLTPMIQALAI